MELAEADVARAQRQHAVRQLQQFQHFRGVARQFLERGIGLVRPHDLHELDLVELVLADQSARVLAVGAGLRAEAGRVRDQLERQFGRIEDAVAREVGQRHFRGRDQE